MTTNHELRAPDTDDTPETQLWLQRALTGDAEAMSWLTDHFHPLLVTQAAECLGEYGATPTEAEDLAQQTWFLALPGLTRLRFTNERQSATIIRHLGLCLLRHERSRRTGAPPRHAPKPRTQTEEVHLSRAGERLRESLRATPHSQRSRALSQTIARLPDTERRILVHRGVEQAPYGLIERKLGIPVPMIRSRYRLTLSRLQSVLPACIIDELADVRSVQPGPTELEATF